MFKINLVVIKRKISDTIITDIDETFLFIMVQKLLYAYNRTN